MGYGFRVSGLGALLAGLKGYSSCLAFKLWGELC